MKSIFSEVMEKITKELEEANGIIGVIDDKYFVGRREHSDIVIKLSIKDSNVMGGIQLC